MSKCIRRGSKSARPSRLVLPCITLFIQLVRLIFRLVKIKEGIS